MTKKILSILILLSLSWNAYSQRDTTSNVLHGITNSTDTVEMTGEYIEQLTDLDLMEKVLKIRRIPQNQQFVDSVAAFRERTGINIYAETYLSGNKLWTKLAEKINYYDAILPPFILYDVKLTKSTNDSLKVFIQAFIDGISIADTLPVLKKNTFKIAFKDAEKTIIDTLISKFKSISENKYSLYGEYVRFFKDPTQEYGFDRFDPNHPEMLTYYQQFAQGGSPFQPFKSIESEKSDKIKAVIDTSGLEIKYRTSISSTINPENTENDTINLTFNSAGSTVGEPFDVEAYHTVDDEDFPLGHFKAISYDKIEKEVIIVNVNDNNFENFGRTDELEAELNRIYKPAIASFNVSTTVEHITADYTTDGEAGFYGNPPNEVLYTQDMLEVVNVYQKTKTVNNDKLYVFLVDGSTDLGQYGYSPFSQPFMFLFADKHKPDEIKDLAHTIAHEIGHAGFNLQHPVMLTSEANNLMESYADNVLKTAKDQLWLIQWDVVHGGNLTGFWGEGREYSGDQGNAILSKVFSNAEVQLKLRELRESYIYGTKVFFTSNYVKGAKKIKIGNYNYNYIYITNNIKNEESIKFGLILEDDYITRNNPDKQYGFIFNNLKIFVSSSDERKLLVDFLNFNEENIYGSYPNSIVNDGIKYDYETIHKGIEELRVELQKSGTYQKLSIKQKLMIDLPILEWKLSLFYTSIFMYNWYKSLELHPEWTGKINENILKVESIGYRERLESSAFFKNKLDKGIEELKNGVIYNTEDLKTEILELIIEPKIDSLEIGETFSIKRQNEFELGYHESYFANRDIDITGIIDNITDLEGNNLDDFIGSWGSVGIKFYMTGTLKKTAINEAEIKIHKMYYRLTDRFDFPNDMQYLGNWIGGVFSENTLRRLSTNSNEIIKDETILLWNNNFYNLRRDSKKNFQDFRPVSKFYEIKNQFSKVKITVGFWGTSFDVE